MSAHSPKVTSLPNPQDRMPNLLAREQGQAKPNPLTPTLKPPRASLIARAVIECEPAIKRAEMAKVIEPVAPYLAKELRECPEPDPKGEPNEQFYYAWKCLGTLNIACNCYGIEHPLLLMAQGQERAHFVHFEEHASVRYAP